MTNRVLITGASSGIGAQLAIQYSKASLELILIARRKEKLEAVKYKCLEKNPNLKVSLFLGNVDNFDFLDSIAKHYETKHEWINTVIANAGIGVSGKFSDLQIDDFKNQFDTNIYGVLHTAKIFEKHLRNTSGKFAITSSILSYFVVKNNIPYCMSKYAVRALAEGLQLEWKKHSISVTHIAPGLIDSDFRLRDNTGLVHKDRPDPAPKFLVMPSKLAAKQIFHAVEARQKEMIITYHGKFLVFCSLKFKVFLSYILRFIDK